MGLNMIKNNHKNKSGSQWAQELGLEIESFVSGWNNENEFNNLLISRPEFFNRAAISKVKAPEIKSRKDAALLKSKLLGKN